MEFVQRRTRPETTRYNQWNEKKKEEDFKFREVLPFGGIIKKGGNLGRKAKEKFEKNRNQNLEGVVFQPDTAWDRPQNVTISFIKYL